MNKAISTLLLFYAFCGCQSKSSQSSIETLENILMPDTSEYLVLKRTQASIPDSFDNAAIPIHLLDILDTLPNEYRLPQPADYPDYFFSGHSSKAGLPYFCSGQFNNDSLMDYALVLIKDSISEEIIVFHSNSKKVATSTLINRKLTNHEDKRVVNFLIETEYNRKIVGIDRVYNILFDGIGFTDMYESHEWIYVWDTLNNRYERHLFD